MSLLARILQQIHTVLDFLYNFLFAIYFLLHYVPFWLIVNQFQDDGSDEERAGSGSPPVTSQPSPKKGPGPVFAMPAPSASAGESAALNQGDVPVYTPGKCTFYQCLLPRAHC